MDSRSPLMSNANSVDMGNISSAASDKCPTASHLCSGYPILDSFSKTIAWAICFLQQSKQPGRKPVYFPTDSLAREEIEDSDSLVGGTEIEDVSFHRIHRPLVNA